MNERHEQLMAQAWIEFAPDAKAVTKRFAELIVKECAQVCLSQRDPANLNYKPSEQFAEAVKQHFGVAE
jgi:hypothetical protein